MQAASSRDEMVAIDKEKKADNARQEAEAHEAHFEDEDWEAGEEADKRAGASLEKQKGDLFDRLIADVLEHAQVDGLPRSKGVDLPDIRITIPDRKEAACREAMSKTLSAWGKEIFAPQEATRRKE